MTDSAPFGCFAAPVPERSALRRAITAAYRRAEPDCVAAMLEGASLPDEMRAAIAETGRALIAALRSKQRGTGLEGLIQEYTLSSQEGVALMCLAEAVLRIPDHATRDALIRDKLCQGDWRSHLGDERSLFVNAATWGLMIAGKLYEDVDSTGLAAALRRVVARAGEPVIRRGVEIAMRLMGEQFVTGETIAQALDRAREMEAKGFRYSYDMLGEAAVTARDAVRYYRDYERAIHAIGKASAGRGIYEGPGISVKLSALHPRYSRAQAGRVMDELVSRVTALAKLSAQYDIGFNIDAEEADRLELSLDILERLALDPDLAGWNGLGFVVQAYGKRAAPAIGWIIDLARRARRRIMVRLVKGAYWDSEIKRAQVDGLADFPVFTRKAHTDVAYAACARKLLGAGDAVFPQFATHNAQTLATIYHLAGPQFATGQYEFQCLHGMGEALYEQVVGAAKLDRPCRIYAPVGTHETLLAYLVRRLLENGANSSFVNRIANPAIPLDELLADPVDLVRAMPRPGSPHEQIRLPRDIYGERRNSPGIDLSDEDALAGLSEALSQSCRMEWSARPVIAGKRIEGPSYELANPADHRDVVGRVVFASPSDADAAADVAAQALRDWSATPVATRAAILERAAEAIEERMPVLLGLIVREAGKSIANAIAEVREAIDFLRYYASEARGGLDGQSPLGPIVCISPWNFPLAIFMGQVAAALVAGNTVLAKPAEETPLIAAEAVRLLHGAGVPEAVLQFIPGDGRIGAALVASPQVEGVMFTGSTEVARLIQGQLAERLSHDGRPIPLIAETGGQNAMIVDSSALPEQVVADVIASAFDSAGQRCSALRILCLQNDIADQVLAMLKGAVGELRIGSPDRLAIDIGPVISAEAKAFIDRHIAAMRARGHRAEQLDLPAEADHGTFVAPAIIEIAQLSELTREVFGPVLHVVRFQATGLDALIDAINASGYGLTFGLHSRSDTTIAHVAARVNAGNIYINRNVIGAVVGVQPFGGRGLSGTGPKAGGPLYVRRLVRGGGWRVAEPATSVDPAVGDLIQWLDARGDGETAGLVRRIANAAPLRQELELPGPVGERNIYARQPRGTVMLRPVTRLGLFNQLASALAGGNDFSIEADARLMAVVRELPPGVLARGDAAGEASCALVEGAARTILAVQRDLAQRPGRIVPIQSAGPDDMADHLSYCPDWLVEEVSISANITAAGGNASLMALEP